MMSAVGRRADNATERVLAYLSFNTGLCKVLPCQLVVFAVPRAKAKSSLRKSRHMYLVVVEGLGGLHDALYDLGQVTGVEEVM